MNLTQEEILEGNKLIVETFLGVKPDPFYFLPQFEELREDKEHSPHVYKESYFSLEELKFHSSFDWLMPVCEKIKEIGEKEFKYSVEFEIAILTLNIDRIYKAVIAFIKWYNQNK